MSSSLSHPSCPRVENDAMSLMVSITKNQTRCLRKIIDKFTEASFDEALMMVWIL